MSVKSDKSSTSLGIQEIKQLLPHRYPFLMVDRVKEIKEARPGEIPGRVCTALKNVTGNEPFFIGHFPDNPVMPGVLIIEAIAQAAALCCCGIKGDPPISRLFFAGLDKARFKNPVFPGDVLDLKVEVKRKKADFLWGMGTAFTGDKLACRVDILAHIVFKPDQR